MAEKHSHIDMDCFSTIYAMAANFKQPLPSVVLSAALSHLCQKHYWLRENNLISWLATLQTRPF